MDMSTLLPHGACLLWKPGLIWLNAISDAMAALAFFMTAFVLTLFLWRRRREVMFSSVLWAFAIFMTACGATRLLSILTLWVPAYDIEGLAKGFLALISMALTAAMLLMRPRLVVTRSARNTFAQLIDDVAGVTLASASTLDADIRGAQTLRDSLSKGTTNERPDAFDPDKSSQR